MDIVKTKAKQTWKLPLIAGSIALALIATFLLASSPTEQKIERSKILVGKVQRGELHIAVDGYGILRSHKQTLITALTSATVAEVILRPGAVVEEGSVILRLSNPELLREMETATIALAQEEANLRRLQLTNQRELLNEQAALAELNAQLQAISLRREAEQGLAGGAVSQLTFKTTLLQEQQYLERVKLQQERIGQLKKVGQEAVLIQQKQINRAESQCRDMHARVDALTVKAGIKGLVQRLPVELGQSLSAGQEVALVGSDKDLKALIRVSQSRAEQLQIGQTAQIKIRQQNVAGKIARITPEVRDGTIEVEILIDEALPAAARPELNVDARIFVATIEDALFIERPVNVQGNSNASLYRLHTDNNIAEVQQVSFGEDSDKYIQIKSGAQEQDQFILSDMNNYRDAKKLRLVP